MYQVQNFRNHLKYTGIIYRIQEYSIQKSFAGYMNYKIQESFIGLKNYLRVKKLFIEF